MALIEHLRERYEPFVISQKAKVTWESRGWMKGNRWHELPIQTVQYWCLRAIANSLMKATSDASLGYIKVFISHCQKPFVEPSSSHRDIGFIKYILLPVIISWINLIGVGNGNGGLPWEPSWLSLSRRVHPRVMLGCFWFSLDFLAFISGRDLEIFQEEVFAGGLCCTTSKMPKCRFTDLKARRNCLSCLISWIMQGMISPPNFCIP